MSGGSDPRPVDIRKLDTGDYLLFKDIRLRSLQDSPTAFCGTHEDAAARSDEQWREHTAERTEPSRAAVFVAEHGDDAVGVISGELDRDISDRAWLQSMWVDPGWRRLGVATRLVAAVIDWAEAIGTGELMLHVTSGNDPARRLYERMGFRFTSETMPHPRRPDLVEREMRQVIGESRKRSG